jgi:hypothetical protein
MQLRKVTIDVAPEADDVMVLVRELVKTMKQGGDFSGLVDELFTAVKGIEQVPTEAKENIAAVLASVAARGVEIAQILLEPKVITLEGK